MKLNMNDYMLLRNAIVNYLKEYKTYELNGICKKYGVECDNSLDPMRSKRVYLESRLSSLNFEQLTHVAKQIISEGCNVEFVKSVEMFFNDDFFIIPMTTRRALLNWISSQPDLEGELPNIYEMLLLVWNLNEIEIKIFTGDTCTADEYILQHMVRNDDIDNGECFENILEFMYIPDRQLFKLLETIVNPPVRDDQSQYKYVSEINSIIGKNGFRLVSEKNIAGINIYELKQFIGTGIPGDIHNIIFGAYEEKPDIIIDDSLTNKLKLVGDNEKCLFYDVSITSEGLTWHDLLIWWNNGDEEYNLDVEKKLVDRLKLSLDSNPEILFLRTYYNYLHKLKNSHLPALIPQVYCHYDPKSAYMRNGQGYVLQRMDFLMLLPGNVRVVIEIDGKQHYAHGNEASPEL